MERTTTRFTWWVFKKTRFENWNKKIKYSKDTCEIVDIVFVNDGNIEANVRVIFVFVPIQAFINFESSQFKFQKNDLGYKVYRLGPSGTNAETIAAGSDIILPFSLKILKNTRIKLDIGLITLVNISLDPK